MNDDSAWKVIITSALTASLTSGVFLLAISWLDRRARRRESLFNLAFKIAAERNDLLMKVAQNNKQAVLFRDTVFSAEIYLKWLEHLYRSGELPKEAIEE